MKNTPYIQIIIGAALAAVATVVVLKLTGYTGNAGVIGGGVGGGVTGAIVAMLVTKKKGGSES